MVEIEWEFADGGESVGQFMPTGKVFFILRAHLVRGEIDEAVALYESCVQNVGDQLWKEFESASTSMKKAIANLFFRSRDYARSAAACEKLGEWVAAGRSYEAAYDLARAAQCYRLGNAKEKAAAVHEKLGEYRDAAELYFEVHNFEASALALERSGDLLGAAQLYMTAKNDARKAAQLLAQVQPDQPQFVQAVGLLVQALLKLGRKDLAIKRLQAALPKNKALEDSAEAELAYRLGRLLLDSGSPEEARPHFEQVKAFNPSYRDIDTCLASVQRVEPSNGLRVGGAPGLLPAPGRATSSVDTRPNFDPFATIDGNPFAAKKTIRPPPAAQTIPIGFVTRMDGYELLKKIPLFSELSLDEMKAFHAICDQVYYRPGDVIIEEGRRGEALVIVREGTIRVTKGEGDKAITLASLPAGNCVGEMALVDDGPTSACVTADTPVTALRIRRDRFEQFIFANDRIALRIYRSFVRSLSTRLRETNAQMSRS